jgi:hypothetical protein
LKRPVDHEVVMMAEDERIQSDTTAAAPAPLPPAPDLARQVRNLRRWLIGLTLLIVLLVLGACGVGTLLFARFFGVADEGSTVSADQVAAVRQDYAKGLEGDLASLDVRAVSLKFDGPSFGPLGIPGPVPTEQSVYVEYRLKSSNVVFANVLSPEGGPDTGLLPTQGSLGSSMSDAQFHALVKAYEAQTSAPFGGAHRYSDDRIDDQGPPASALSIGGKDYPTKELWAVVQGVVVKGDTFDPNKTMNSSKALVFHEDPKTHTFTFIGTDSGDRWSSW